MIKRGGLFAKYAIPLVVLVSGALVVSGLTQIYFSYQESKTALARIQYEKAAAAAIRIEQFARQVEHDLSWIAQTPWRSPPDDPLDQRRLDSLRLLRQAPAITEVSHIDPTGHEQLRVSRLAMDVVRSNKDFSQDPRFKDAMARKIYFSPIYFRKESEPYMTVAMTGATEDTGVVAAEANLKFIWDVVSNLKVGKQGNAYVIDERGRLIAHPDISLVLQKTDLSQLPQVRAALEANRDDGAPAEAMVGLDLRGTDVLTAHAKIVPLNWTVFVDLPIAEAFAPLYASILRTLLLVLAGVIISAAASLYLVRRMVSPIQVLRAGAARIGAGALDHRIDVRSGDELQALADEFNGMTERLQDSYAGLERKVEERTAELQESLEHQTATAEILRAISQSPADVQPVFEAIAIRARKLCSADHVGVTTFDGELLYGAATSNNLSPEEVESLRSAFPRPPSRGTVTGRAILDRTVVAIDDISGIENYELAEAAQRVGFRSALAVPMLREGSPIGGIAIMRTRSGGFSDAEIELLKTFADQAVIAIENTRLFKELQSRTQDLAQSVKQLQSLAEVTQAVNSTLDLQEVLSAIVTRAVQLSNADGGAVYEYDEASKEFRAQATYGFPPELVTTVLATPMQFNEGATGLAATQRAPVQIADLSIAGAYNGPLENATKSAGVLAVLAVPLLREDRILGSLVVTRNSVGEFPKEMVDVLQTFAAQSTLAIQNARLFREIEQKSHELEIASQHKSAFLANMSHELRTPLNAIIGFSEVLKDGLFGKLAPKQDEYIRDIHSSGLHLLSLINDILDLSKVEAGRMELSPTSFNVPAAISDALTLVRERAKKHGVELDSEIDANLQVFTGDERMFKQIMLNLLSNAVKFTPAGGSVAVHAISTEAGLQVAVKDTGVGIAKENQEAIFDAFQQVDGGRDSAREGTGLGLSLARSFVEMHNGRIWVESKVSEGSTFTFTLESQS